MTQSTERGGADGIAGFGDTHRILADLGYSSARIEPILDKDAEVHDRGGTPTNAAPASAAKEH